MHPHPDAFLHSCNVNYYERRDNMKDLKHLIFFENLLQDAQNELVTQAVNDGKIALDRKSVV